MNLVKKDILFTCADKLHEEVFYSAYPIVEMVHLSIDHIFENFINTPDCSESKKQIIYQSQ